MPYIPQDLRDLLDVKVPQFERTISAGELNYFITRTLLSTNPGTYSEYNTLIGVLESVKLELYRRAVAPYEDWKRNQNGEVYPNEL